MATATRFGNRARWLCAAALASCALACGADGGEGETQASIAALSVCDETVPGTRNIDGVPAYAQCSASSSAAIYSDDGVNTATTQMGPDWVRTQYSGGYQCTELAHRYLYFRWNIDWVPRGNAGTWCDTQPPATIGVVQTTTPVHGDVMVLAPGSCGADGTTGHVNLIDVVNTDGSLIAVEQNGARRGTYKGTCAKCFLHVMANDGTPSSIPSTPGNPAQGSAGSAAPPTGTAGSMSPPPATTPPATVPPPPATTPTTPPAGVPSVPVGVPTAGSAAPAPSAPAPITPAPTTAPVPAAMAATPAAPSYMPPARTQSAQDSGCAVSATGAGTHAAGSLAPFAALMLALLRRRTRARG
jgi:surface antigen